MVLYKSLQTLKSRYDEWREFRFLQNHNCENREQYNLRYDPLHNFRATRIVDFYHGYNYIHCFENDEHEIYDLQPMVGSYFVNEWCKETLSGKWRLDYHRAIKYLSTGNEWVINEIGGGDYIFAAFTDERDYILFLLRWS